MKVFFQQQYRTVTVVVQQANSQAKLPLIHLQVAHFPTEVASGHLSCGVYCARREVLCVISPRPMARMRRVGRHSHPLAPH